MSHFQSAAFFVTGGMTPPLYTDADFKREIPIENEDRNSWRSPFRRDFARLLHSPAFRRLQGKTQLFSGLESDFFRNRLTHSLEVAQIAKSIAIKINRANQDRSELQLDCDLVEFAGLAHDLGHPPFGHTGEAILNEIMAPHGGFEGNAQTLRILTRLEKKVDDPGSQLTADGNPIWFQNGTYYAKGLNPCARTIAAVLKYDRMIPERSPRASKLNKGYYATEAEIVQRVRRAVAPSLTGELKTVECQIMDISDDIAYSTYDLDDAFKAGLVSPLDLFIAGKSILTAVAKRARLNVRNKHFSAIDAAAAIRRTFWALDGATKNSDAENGFADTFMLSKSFAESGFYRNWLTSDLVSRFVAGVSLTYDPENPATSQVVISEDILEEIEVLKHFTYISMVQSNKLRIVEHRAKHIVKAIMGALCAPGGNLLLPPDFAEMYDQATKSQARQRYSKAPNSSCMRVVCDFVAGMTDKYAVEFYCRLQSENYQTIFRSY